MHGNYLFSAAWLSN